jgi:hypothetical protein
MKKYIGKWVWVGFAIFGAACGGNSYKLQFTCDQVASKSQCVVYKTNDASDSDVRAECEANGGTASVDPCSRDGLLGICTISESGSELDIYIYPSDIASTTAGAKTGCDNAKGSFSTP